MKKPRDFLLYAGLGTLLGIALLSLLFLGPRWLRTPPPAATESSVVSAVDARKIRARLFYVNESGTGLTSVEQEVVYGEGPVEQAKRLVEAQLATPAPPLATAIPAGTTLRGVFLTKGGDAYVDLSRELQANHPGGTTNEILTVYALVSALTSNLPAVTGVQILIDGKEVDTLGGHLDLRRPIEHDPRWVSQ
ncbi:MAG TPA: GerMN domain-containing protein [Vicinamibacterales bacterium]|nr:GerMN domain-containing protein [Vicinamibacterales bacterium]